MSLKKAVIEKVVAGLILSGILYACSFIPGFYPAIWQFTKDAWAYTFASTSVPRWLLWLLVVLSATLVLRVAVGIFSRASGPSLFDYREDTILGLLWRWDYGSHGPQNLWCYCPTCDTSLVYSEARDYSEYGGGRNVIHLTCEHCGNRIKEFEGNRDYLLSRVLRQIDRTQRNGDWKKRIPNAAA